MKLQIKLKKKLNNFNKSIVIDGDKSISIRSLLLASQSYGKCTIKNLVSSEDIISTIKGLKRLGVNIIFNQKNCVVYGNGINGFNYKKNITINAGNSGTFARLILALLIKSPNSIKLIGDKSLSKRDFDRIVQPLQKFGAKFDTSRNKGLPLKIIGTEYLKPIHYIEKRGSAQCKSAVMLAALNTPGTTKILAKKSRDHTEIMYKYLNIPIKIKSKKKFDQIEVTGQKNFKSFNYSVPSDPSSCAFFIVLTILSKNSKLLIKNVNINQSRIGYIRILNKMGAKIKIKNVQKKYGEKIGDIYVKSQKNLKKINCPTDLNSNLIDEFLIIFLVAAKARGVSYFSKIGELNKKESPRLKIGSEILKKIGIKNELTKDSIKIYGNPDIQIKKKIFITNYLKDHRILMTSVIASLVLGGNWIINDANSFKSSFPSFLKILKKMGYKFSFLR
tara:strand:+ start:1595 stop:2932 length:1338 start_codon:yes stop_codon:yes gene_type:complete